MLTWLTDIAFADGNVHGVTYMFALRGGDKSPGLGSLDLRLPRGPLNVIQL